MKRQSYLQKVGDIFRIEDRLKEINPNYEVFFNGEKERFEVYEKRGENLVLAFVSPFDTLDARLVNYARKTRIERIDEVVREIEEDNHRLENEENRKREEERNYKLMKLKERLKTN